MPPTGRACRRTRYGLGPNSPRFDPSLVFRAFMSEVEYGNIPPLVSIAAASVQAYRTEHGLRFYIYTAPPRLDAPVRAQLIAHSCYGNEGSALWHLFVDMHTASASSSSSSSFKGERARQYRPTLAMNRFGSRISPLRDVATEVRPPI